MRQKTSCAVVMRGGALGGAWLLLCGAASVSVRDFGAVGDGVHDDQPQIALAVAALVQRGGGTLVFPRGSYRDAAPGKPALVLSGVKNVSVVFQDGAEIVMDNAASASGIQLIGPASNVTLSHVKLRWVNRPAGRTQGQGIEVHNPAVTDAIADYSKDRSALIAVRAIRGLKILYPDIENAPGAGIVIDGTAGYEISDGSITAPAGDGIFLSHENGGLVTRNRLTDTGDDCISVHREIETHHLAGASLSAGSDGTGYDWNGVGTRITANRCEGQGKGPGASPISAGIGLYGVRGVSVSDLQVTGKGTAFSFYYGGYNGSYGFLASRGVTLAGITAQGVNRLAIFNSIGNDANSPPPLWQSDIKISGVTSRDEITGGPVFEDTVAGTGWHGGIQMQDITELNSPAAGFWAVTRLRDCSVAGLHTAQKADLSGCRISP